MKVRRDLAIASVLVVALCRLSIADEMPLPPDLQAALFKKIFEYDRDLGQSESLVVLVVHDGARFDTAESVVEAFRKTGIASVSLPAGELAGRLEAGSVVYVTDGLDVAAIQELCASKSALSVSGFPELAESGKVAVGIGVHEQKPQILVHLERLKVEGHWLAAELLNLARVIR